MTPTTDFRPIPDFPAYEINRQGTVQRRLRGSIKNTAALGKPLGRKNGTITLEQDGKKLGTTRRALMARIFGPDAVQPWRYNLAALCGSFPGERNGNHRYTPAIVRELRELYATGSWTHRQLAAAFEIPRSTIAQILSNKTWKHLEKTQ